MAAPALPEAGGEQEAWGSPPHCGAQGPVGTVAWTPLLLVLLSLCTGSAGPGHRGSVPGLRQPPGRRLREPFPQLLPRRPVSVSAGSDPQPVLTQPASLSGIISQTLLY